MNGEANELAQLLRRTNELLTILAKKALQDVLEDELRTDRNRDLYELTGGTISVRAISKKVHSSLGSISRKWQRWEELGLLVKDGGRYRKVLG